MDGSLETPTYFGVVWDWGSFPSHLFACSFPHQRAFVVADVSLALCHQLLPEIWQCSPASLIQQPLRNQPSSLLRHPDLSLFLQKGGGDALLRLCLASHPWILLELS